MSCSLDRKRKGAFDFLALHFTISSFRLEFVESTLQTVSVLHGNTSTSGAWATKLSVAIQEYGFSINNPDTWGHRDYIQYIRRFKNSRFLCNTVGRTIVGYTLLAHYKRSDITHYAGKTAIPFILPPS